MAISQQIQPKSIESILDSLSEPRFPKVDEMLGKVFNAPQYKSLELLDKEQAVLDFLAQNREKWHGMLVREGLFSGQAPENMHAVSTRCAIERSNRKLIPLLIEEVRKLDFRFIEILRNSKGLSESLPLDLIDIEIRALKHLSGRAALRGPLEIIRSDVVDRYTLAADEADGAIANMALGPLKKRLNVREINHCVKSSLLLKNTVYLASNAESVSKNGFSALQIQSTIKAIQAKYRQMPGFLLKMGLYANLTPEAVEKAPFEIPTASRYISLLADLGAKLLFNRRNQDGLQELESSLFLTILDGLPDSSKHSVDAVLLKELVSIAEEQNW